MIKDEGTEQADYRVVNTNASLSPFTEQVPDKRLLEMLLVNEIEPEAAARQGSMLA